MHKLCSDVNGKPSKNARTPQFLSEEINHDKPNAQQVELIMGELEQY